MKLKDNKREMKKFWLKILENKKNKSLKKRRNRELSNKKNTKKSTIRVYNTKVILTNK